MITNKEYQKILKNVDKQVKATNGHCYIKILKTKCQYCGRTPKQKGRCPAWLDHFFMLVEVELIKRKLVSKPIQPCDKRL